MIKYRPNRGTLEEAMEDAKEFASIDDMFDYIVSEWNGNAKTKLFDKVDLSIGDDTGADERIGWKETRYVCTRCMENKLYIQPQCIGICSIE